MALPTKLRCGQNVHLFSCKFPPIRQRLIEGVFFDIFTALEKYVDCQKAYKNGSTESLRGRLRGLSDGSLPDCIAPKMSTSFHASFPLYGNRLYKGVFWTFSLPQKSTVT